MSDPIAQVDIETQLTECNASLDTVTHLVAKRARDRAQKFVAFKLANKRAYLAAKGSIPEREAAALLACEKEFTEYEMAEAVLDAAKEAGRNEREKSQNTRSINVNHRALVVGS